MDQFAQTNDLQQAIDNVANGGNATGGASDAAPFGIPPMPPMPENGSDMPKVEPLVPAENSAPSAEQILSQSIGTENMPSATDGGNAAPAVEATSTPAPTPDNTAIPEAAPAGEAPAVEESTPAPETPAEDLSDVKQNILRDLLPLLDKTEKTPEEKFEVYKDAIATMHDVKTSEGAYRTASGIADEAKKADALFELMKVIDAR